MFTMITKVYLIYKWFMLISKETIENQLKK